MLRNQYSKRIFLHELYEVLIDLKQSYQPLRGKDAALQIKY